MNMQKHRQTCAITVLAVILTTSLSACDNGFFGASTEYRMGKYACASKASQAEIKATMFRMAHGTGGANADRIAQIEKGAVATIEQPVVDAVEKDTEKTVCSGTLVLSLPPGSKAAFGLDEMQRLPVRYSVQATADRKGSVYQLFGADDLVAKIASQKSNGPTKTSVQNTANAPVVVSQPSVTNATQPQGTFYYIRGLDPNGDNWLALRPAPSMQGARLAKLGPETLLVSDGTRSGIWLKVETLDGRKGWVASRYTACCK